MGSFMKSMTGYGRSRINDEFHEIEVEIKSVNNRFLDVSFRMPRELSYMEAELKNILSRKMKRGKVTININITHLQTGQLKLNEDKLKSYWNLYQKAAEILEEDAKLPLMNVLSEPDVIILKEDDPEDPVFKNKIISTFEKAILEHEKMAMIEGRSMQIYFLESIEIMEKSLEMIDSEFPNFKKEKFSKLQNNLETLLNDKMDDEALKRIMLEAAMYVEKADITEEVVRLKDHMQKFKEKIIKDDALTGKSINFILQEMHREINTIGSKFSATAIFDQIIIIKEEIEKCREIVQNVE
ncbi:MAG: YicC family protein [Candidatus Cloacimonadota bacterium]|nr:MAG: YicC family protein [Candidatus Cloacimonadota bacterium]